MSAVIESVGGFSGFKMRLLMIGLLIVASGMFWEIGRRNIGSHEARASAVAQASRDWTRGSAKKTAAIHKADTWGKAMVRLGLSFVVAMLIGGLLRAYFKTMVSLFVIAFTVAAVMHYQGFIEPFWEPYLESMGNGKQWLASQTKSGVAFLRGVFPNFAVAVIGLGMGLKR